MKRTVAVLVPALVAASAGGVVVACSNDSPSGDSGRADATSAATGDGSPPDYGSVPGHLPDGAPLPGGECLTDNDCTSPGNQRCLYPVGATCGSLGACTGLPTSAPACADAGFDEVTACSCDGTPRVQLCTQPAGFTRGDIVHAGPCADGGQACTPGQSDCPDGQICGFRVADGCSVTTAHCFDGPDPTVGTSQALLEVCSCDGGRAQTFAGNQDIVAAPVTSLDSCPLLDGGADADADAASDASDASADASDAD
jgi:hypothetical protein